MLFVLRRVQPAAPAHDQEHPRPQARLVGRLDHRRLRVPKTCSTVQHGLLEIQDQIAAMPYSAWSVSPRARSPCKLTSLAAACRGRGCAPSKRSARGCTSVRPDSVCSSSPRGTASAPMVTARATHSGPLAGPCEARCHSASLPQALYSGAQKQCAIVNENAPTLQACVALLDGPA